MDFSDAHIVCVCHDPEHEMVCIWEAEALAVRNIVFPKTGPKRGFEHIF